MRDDVTCPPLGKQAVNLASTIWGAGRGLVATGELLVDAEERQERSKTCAADTCGLFDPEYTRCCHESCGCFLNAKVHLAAAYCPLLMWPGDVFKMAIIAEDLDLNAEEEVVDDEQEKDDPDEPES